MSEAEEINTDYSQFSQAGTEYFEPALGQSKSGPSASEEQQRRLAESMRKGSVDFKTAQPKGPTTGRRLYVMRHAERMDRIFPGWKQLAIIPSTSKYRPYDLNMPLQLPQRQGGYDSFHEDAPLTEMGVIYSKMIGRGMRYNKVGLTHVFASPALRCVQTASALLKSFNREGLEIFVEPGLFEWMKWYPTPPSWMSAEELKKVCEQVSNDYEPVMSMEQLLNARDETPAQHYERLNSVVKKILERYSSNAILIVGHSTNLDAIPRKLMGKQPTVMSDNDMERLGMMYPNCSVVAIEEFKDKTWKPVHNPIPSVTCVDFTNHINAQFFNQES